MLLLLAATAAAATAAAARTAGTAAAAQRPPPGPPPNFAFTCAPGSAEAKLPFCDRKLGFDKRTEDLVMRINQTYQVALFLSYPGTPYIASGSAGESINVKGWSLDHTCIHGLNKASGVTVFPHAIAQGTSWDRDLVRHIRMCWRALSTHSAAPARVILTKPPTLGAAREQRHRGGGAHPLGAGLRQDQGRQPGGGAFLRRRPTCKFGARSKYVPASPPLPPPFTLSKVYKSGSLRCTSTGGAGWGGINIGYACRVGKDQRNLWRRPLPHLHDRCDGAAGAAEPPACTRRRAGGCLLCDAAGIIIIIIIAIITIITIHRDQCAHCMIDQPRCPCPPSLPPSRQVTRHYIAYHGARPDISGGPNAAGQEFIASNRSLHDSYFPTYGAFQRPEAGFADGIMCAMSLMNGVPR
jgi:hypothetical protein